MKVRYTRRAFQDREHIFDYLAERSPAGAQNVTAQVLAAVARLADHPLSGIATDVADVRVVFVGRYPYKVFYRVRGETIDILHIRHTSRRPAGLE